MKSFKEFVGLSESKHVTKITKEELLKEYWYALEIYEDTLKMFGYTANDVVGVMDWKSNKRTFGLLFEHIKADSVYYLINGVTDRAKQMPLVKLDESNGKAYFLNSGDVIDVIEIKLI